MDWKILFEDTMWNLMDSLEEFVDSFNVAGGSRLREVFLVVLGLFGLSIVLRLLNIFAFISWQESGVAVLIMGAILIVDYINVNGTEELKNKLLSFRKGEMEDGE